MVASAPELPPTGSPPRELNTPWVESPFFEEILAVKSPPPDLAQTARQYHDQGYAILEDLVDEGDASRIVNDAASLFTTAVEGARVQDGWKKSTSIARLASHPRVLAMLEFLYGRVSFPFQTLNFRTGSQQSGHSDQLHFSALPARYMCGVWAALEDVNEENGPLFYFPGSHRLPEFDFYDLSPSADGVDYPAYERLIAALMQAKGFRKTRLLVKRGTALI